jgi:hypothetical protein
MQRANFKDHISIYEDSSQENAAKKFRVSTSDLADIAWSPDGLLLAVWDSPFCYNLAIYNTTGACVGSYQAYQGRLGIRCVTWSKDSQLLAVGSYDQVCVCPCGLTLYDFELLLHFAVIVLRFTGEEVPELHACASSPPASGLVQRCMHLHVLVLHIFFAGCLFLELSQMPAALSIHLEASVHPELQKMLVRDPIPNVIRLPCHAHVHLLCHVLAAM